MNRQHTYSKKTQLLLLLFIALLSNISFAQTLSEKEHKVFEKAEVQLKKYTQTFSNDSLSFEERTKAIHDFIPRFVAILKKENSYQYPFDSLLSISKITAPDNAFKIFTWQLKEPLGTHRYYGAIQMNASQLKLFPLFDYSDTMLYHTQKTLQPNNWYGCLYYNCILNTTPKGKKYYTLLGYDKADFVSNRKIIDILSFDNENKAQFGAEPLLFYADSLGNLTQKVNRLFLEYSEKAVISLNYNKDKKQIIFDHIAPPSDREKDAKFSYIPDGTYEGFEWKKTHWQWVSRVYTYSIGKNDSPPMPAPKNIKGKQKNILGQ